MTYLIDTDWVIDLLKGRETARRLVATLADEPVAISIITLGELYEGIYYARDPAAQERALRQLLRSIDVLNLNRAIVKRFARLRGELRRRGLPLPDADVLIAATALHHDATLVTRNRKDFERLPGLKLLLP